MEILAQIVSAVIALAVIAAVQLILHRRAMRKDEEKHERKMAEIEEFYQKRRDERRERRERP